jgi:hypothetical protein
MIELDGQDIPFDDESIFDFVRAPSRFMPLNMTPKNNAS